MTTLHRTRRQRRGSAFIEALAVMMLFTLLLGCALLFGRSYVAKIATMREARERAWQHTEPTAGACRGDSVSQRARALIAAPDARRARALVSALGEHPTGEPGLGRWAGVLPFWPAAERTAFETQTQFTCNETVRTDDSALRALRDRVLP